MKQLLTLILFILASPAWAQDENAKKVTGKTGSFTSFIGGVETSTTPYINTNTKDSTGTSVYLSPYLDYNHKSGLGLKLKSYALPGGSDPGFFLTTISPYFARYDGKVLPYISYTRYIQHDNPSVPYSPIQNEIYAHIRVKTKIVDPRAGIDIGFGQDEQNNDESVSDVNAFAGLSKLILVEPKDKGSNSMLGIVPTIQVNAGTDRYFKYLRTTSYISQNRSVQQVGYGKGRRGQGGSGEPTTTTTETYILSEDNEFSISNIEANLHIIYLIGRFSIEPSGSLYFPMRGDDKTPYGYWQLNLNFWIK